VDKLGLLIDALGWTLAITVVGVGGWLLQTWLRIKHGYPLDGAWGQAIYPSSDRLENIQRIVADRPSRLANEINALGIDKGGNA